MTPAMEEGRRSSGSALQLRGLTSAPLRRRTERTAVIIKSVSAVPVEESACLAGTPTSSALELVYRYKLRTAA